MFGPSVRLVKNFLYLSGGEVLSKLLTFLAIAFVARVVGPTRFGYLEFAFSAVLLAGLLVHQGFGLYGAREIGKDPRSTDRLVAGILSIRFVLAAFGYAGLVTLVALTSGPRVQEELVLLFGVSLLFMPLSLVWVFQGHERMSLAAGLRVLRQMVFLVVTLTLLREANHLWPVAVAEVLAVASVAVGSMWLYRRLFGRHVPLPGRASRTLLREGAVIGVSRVFWSVRISGAMVLFGLIAAGQDVGFFGAAMRILVGLYVFVWLYHINLLPSLSRDWQEETEEFTRRVDRSMWVVGWLSVSAGTLWILLAPLAVHLVYGREFLPAAPALQLFSLVCVAAAIHGHYRFSLIAAGRQRDEMITSVVGTMVALPLIPFGYALWGVTGAAAALVVGEATIWLTSWLFARRILGLPWLSRHLVTPVICGTLLLALCWRLQASGLPTAAVIAIAALGLATAALTLDPEVRRAIASVFGHTAARKLQ